jgi:hypothetical protein
MRANGSFSLEVRKMRLIGVTRFVTRMLWLRMMRAADDCDPERTAALQAAECSWYPQRRECGGADDGLAIGSFGEYVTTNNIYNYKRNTHSAQATGPCDEA